MNAKRESLLSSARHKVAWANYLLALIVIGATTSPTPSHAGPWTVDDNIQIKRLQSSSKFAGRPSPFSYSPNRDLVAFVTVSSDIETDSTAAILRVFPTSDLRTFANEGGEPSPAFETIVRTNQSRPGIGSLTWAPDGSTLFFLARANGVAKLMGWNRNDHHTQLIADVAGGISTYKLMAEGQIIVFAPYTHSASNSFDNPSHSPIVATGKALPAVLFDDYEPQWIARPHRMIVINWKGKQHKRDYGVVALPPPFGGIVISPDQRHLAFTEPMQAEWTGSCWRKLHTESSSENEPRVFGLKLAVLDLESGEVTRPFDAPLGNLIIYGGYTADIAIWSRDGKKAIVPFTFTSHDRCDPENPTARHDPGAYVFSLDRLSPEPVYRYEFNKEGELIHGPRSFSWNSDNTRLLFTLGGSKHRLFRTPPLLEKPDKAIVYEYNNRWEEISRAIAGPPEKSTQTELPQILEVKEDYNTPPAIHVVGEEGRSRMLYDLAPHARARRFGDVEVVEWEDKAGIKWNGLLALPPEYQAGQRIPLILQTHDYRPGKFFAEGPTTTAFPGRAALVRGFAVLTITDTGNRDVYLGPKPLEGERVVEGYRAAIRVLDERGIIDPAKVGVIGWSRTSYYVKYAITKAPELFAAAVGVDGLDYGYGQYLISLDWAERPFPEQYRATYGGPPWVNSDTWLAEAPGFNLQNVRTPFRSEANSGRAQTLWEWEFYAGLRRLHKPTDLIVYPDGEHSLFRPSYRKASTEGSLDWLDYWINDHKDANPKKEAQYKRWDAIKEERRIYQNK